LREHPSVLQERVGVGDVECAGGGVPDVREERRPGHLVRFAVERAVAPRCHRLLAKSWLTRGVEHPEAGPVRVTATLGGQIVGGVEQPEGCGDRAVAGVQAEEPAHPSPDQVV
jgi:hypothetical protein